MIFFLLIRKTDRLIKFETKMCHFPLCSFLFNFLISLKVCIVHLDSTTKVEVPRKYAMKQDCFSLQNAFYVSV